MTKEYSKKEMEKLKAQSEIKRAIRSRSIETHIIELNKKMPSLEGRRSTI